MILNNTTDIPDQLIKIAVGFSIAAGVEIDTIVVKNKMAGRRLGQWGWYKHWSKTIVLIVPRDLTHGVYERQKYSRYHIAITSRSDFVVSVMAHELRHAWQFQQFPDLYAGELNRRTSELDAEAFERRKLAEWQAMYGDVAQAARSVK